MNGNGKAKVTIIEPCPFCGSEEVDVRPEYVLCLHCNAQGPDVSTSATPHSRGTDAVQAWNSRG